jgi:hypothetical protein
MAMASLRWWLRASVGFTARGVVFATLACALHAAAAETPAPAPEPISSVTVEPGESWISLRARFCPLETVQAANPRIGEKLKVGDVVRSPFVLSNAVERANQARTAAERRAEEAAAQQKESDAKLAAFQSLGLEQKLDEANSDTSKWRAMALSSHVVVALLALLLVAALAYAFVMRRNGAIATTRLVDTDRRYAELRQSLLKLDTEVQRRALKLLAGHGARVITEAEFAETTRPLLENVVQLRQKHTG